MRNPKNSGPQGLIAATFTPFHQNGDLNLSLIPHYINHLVKQGVKGIFVCGSTGEGQSLTLQERKNVAEAFVQSAQKRLFTFVHVGHESLREAANLAEHAAHIGADAISLAPPSYFKLKTIDTLIKVLQDIAKAAPDLPLYYYHIPIKTGIDLDMIAFLNQAKNVLPSLGGIKFTSYQLDTLQRCQQLKPFQILFGRDELFLGAISMGTTGFIGSTYNFMASIYHQIQKAHFTGDHEDAADLQQRVSQLVSYINQYGGLAPQKVMMRLAGIEVGPVRLPLANLTIAEEELLIAELKKNELLTIFA